jgi:hypothetical protein
MSGVALKWAMDLPRDALPDAAARHVLLVLAWNAKDRAPVYASVAHLRERTSLNVKTIRRALTYLIEHRLISDTGTRHRNMPRFVLNVDLQPLPKTVVFEDVRPLPKTVVVNGTRTLLETAGFKVCNPYRFYPRPLPKLPPTPTVFGTQTRKQRINKGPAVCMGDRDGHVTDEEREEQETVARRTPDRPGAMDTQALLRAALAHIKRPKSGSKS